MSARERLLKAIQSDPVVQAEIVELLLSNPQAIQAAKEALAKRKKLDESRPNRKAMMFGYGRVSYVAAQKKQANGMVQSDSVERQHEAIKRFHESKGQELGLIWGGFHSDEAVSGSKSFSQRPNGSKLAREIKTGDHLVFAKLDRGFRNLMDMQQHLAAWKARGITVHFLDCNFDTNSPIGEMMITMMGLFAQFERDRIRERLIAGHQRRRELHGGKLPQSKPRFYQTMTRKNGKPVFELNPDVLAHCGMLATLSRRGWEHMDITTYAWRAGLGIPCLQDRDASNVVKKLRRRLNVYEKYPHECEAALAARPELMEQWPDEIVRHRESRRLSFEPTTRRLSLDKARDRKPTNIELI